MRKNWRLGFVSARPHSTGLDCTRPVGVKQKRSTLQACMGRPDAAAGLGPPGSAGSESGGGRRSAHKLVSTRERVPRICTAVYRKPTACVEGRRASARGFV